MMWDIRGSTNQESRDAFEPKIATANRRIAMTLGSRALDFRPASRDDGNGLVCEGFSDVLAVFQILLEVFEALPFRAGCEANIQGRLNYYPKSKALGGRAFEHAARIANMFKEIRDNPGCWMRSMPPAEPEGSYLLVGEFARRFAQKEGVWPPANFDAQDPPGEYEARVRAALPISVAIVREKH